MYPPKDISCDAAGWASRLSPSLATAERGSTFTCRCAQHGDGHEYQAGFDTDESARLIAAGNEIPGPVACSPINQRVSQGAWLTTCDQVSVGSSCGSGSASLSAAALASAAGWAASGARSSATRSAQPAVLLPPPAMYHVSPSTAPACPAHGCRLLGDPAAPCDSHITRLVDVST